MQLSLKMLAIPNERPTLESYTDNLVTFVPFQLHLITTQSNVYIYIYFNGTVCIPRLWLEMCIQFAKLTVWRKVVSAIRNKISGYTF